MSWELGLRSWTDTATNAATAAENKPVFDVGMNLRRGTARRMTTHEDKNTVCVSFPILGHLLVLFSGQLQVHGKQWTGSINES
jgi:hypothetical protein